MKRVHWAEYLHANPAVCAVALGDGGGGQRALAFLGAVPRADIARRAWVGAGGVRVLSMEYVQVTGLPDHGWQFTLRTQADADAWVLGTRHGHR